MAVAVVARTVADTPPRAAASRLHGLRPPAAGCADVWVGRVPDPLDAGAGLVARTLDDVELRRASSFAQPRHRARYVAAHLGLRALLGAYLGVPAAGIALTRQACPLCGGAHGRPAAAAAHPLQFSMSHTDDIVVYAVASDPVGVDVESRAPVELALLDPYLHPAERAALERVARERRADALLGCWVRKEAYLKGLGTGLAVALDAVHVGLPERLSPSSRPGPRPPGWTIADLDIGDVPAAVALATRGRGAPLRTRLCRLDIAGLVTAMAQALKGAR